MDDMQKQKTRTERDKKSKEVSEFINQLKNQAKSKSVIAAGRKRTQSPHKRTHSAKDAKQKGNKDKKQKKKQVIDDASESQKSHRVSTELAEERKSQNS